MTDDIEALMDALDKYDDARRDVRATNDTSTVDRERANRARAAFAAALAAVIDARIEADRSPVK